LYKTTAGYGGCNDADLPALYLLDGIYDYYLFDNTSEISFDMYLSDTSLMNMSVFIDDVFWEEFTDLTTGSYQVTIPEELIIPNLNESCNNVIFILTDNYGHKTSWVAFMEDQRTLNATWLPWIEGEEEVRQFKI